MICYLERQVLNVKYKVNFNSVAYVDADSEDEAIDKFNSGYYIYREFEADSAEEVSDDLIDI